VTRKVWSPGGKKWVEVIDGDVPPSGLDKFRSTTASTPAKTKPVRVRQIGCPLDWFEQVYPIMKSKGELAVALYLWRLRVVTGSTTVTVTNKWLRKLKIDRHTKANAIRRLEQAGIVQADWGGQTAVEVTFCA
jgi:hypothetical protein